MKRAREWLAEGDKVKATIWFRGREMTHRELGARILEQLEKDLKDVGDVEMRPRMEGNQMFTIFMPKKHKSPKDRSREPARHEPGAGSREPTGREPAAASQQDGSQETGAGSQEAGAGNQQDGSREAGAGSQVSQSTGGPGGDQS